HWVVVFFGGFLIFTGIKLFVGKEKPPNPEKNLMIRLLRRLLPVSHELEGPHFLSKRYGKIHATPLLVGLVFLEATDIVFAVDSVPAIFAFTSEPLIVFTSNIFAILGLRALYFMLAGAIEKFYLLRYGLGTVLVFVGLKMVWLNQLFDGKFPITVSLTIIGVLIGSSVALSLLFPKKHPSGTRMVSEASAANRQLEPQRLEVGQGGDPGWSGNVSRSTVRVLRKAIAIYLLLLGLGLILRAALDFGF